MMIVTVWHGTAAVHWPSIQSEGLKPKHDGGADQWAKKHHWAVADNSAMRPPSIYVTTSQDEARMFANYSAEVLSDDPILVELHIPASEFETRFVEDEDINTGGMENTCYRCAGEVPPVWIVKKVEAEKMQPEENPLFALLGSLLEGAR